MPTHSHGVTDPGHTHVVGGQYSIDGPGGSRRELHANATSNVTSQSRTTGITINNAGSGGAHNHGNTGASGTENTGSMSANSTHTHTESSSLSSAQSIMPPYIALVKIMKI